MNNKKITSDFEDAVSADKEAVFVDTTVEILRSAVKKYRKLTEHKNKKVIRSMIFCPVRKVYKVY